MSNCKSCDGTGLVERTSFNQSSENTSWTSWTEPCEYCSDEDDYDWRVEEDQ
jgi:DnaJ-class molecular chaperone